MKKNFFKEMFISAVAPFVKLFPMGAIKHTLRSNRYAYKFQLSHKREMEVLRRIYRSTDKDGLKWLSLHLWWPETRIACLKDDELWRIFIDDIRNSAEFKAAYENVREQAVTACTKYTLSKDEVVEACNDTALNIEPLLAKQPQSFTPDLVSRLQDYGRAELFRLLFKAQKLEMLQSLDTILYQDKSSGVEDLEKIAKGCLNSLMQWEKYSPSLEPKQLCSLPWYATWEEKANPVVVASTMGDYWHEGLKYDKILTFVRILAKIGSKDAIGEAKNLVFMLPNGEKQISAVRSLVNKGVAMPLFVKCLLQDEETLAKNLLLCQQQGLIGKVRRMDFELLPEKHQATILFALAKENKLPKDLFEKVDPELQAQLFNIIEENAQAAWFEPLYCKGPVQSDIDNIKTWRKISSRVQDMSMTYESWAIVFVDNQFYDETHIIKLIQSRHSSAITRFAAKHGLTKEQYTALLFGNQAALAPELESYIKK